MRAHSPALETRPPAKASRRPARLGVRLSDGGPERFFDSEAAAKSSPEIALLCAVLENAFVCFQNRYDIADAKAAENWFLSDDSRAIFSFLSVCAALGVEPDFIRKRLDRLRQDHVESSSR